MPESPTAPRDELEPAASGLRTTMILFGVVLALGLFMKLAEPDLKPPGDPLSRRHRVFALLEEAEVTRIEARPASGPAIVVAKLEPEKKLDPAEEEAKRKKAEEEGAPPPEEEAERWRLESPVQDDADLAEVRRARNQIAWLETTDRLEGEKAEKYDFGPVALTLTIARADGKPALGLELGDERLGVRPARAPGTTAPVWIIANDLWRTWTADVWTFRAKELFAQREGVVDRVALEVQDGARRVELVKDQTFWFVGEPKGSDYAKRGLVDELVGNARALRAVGIERDDPTAEDLARCGLAPTPWARLTIARAAQGAAAPGAAPATPGAGPRPAPETLEVGGLVPDATTTRYGRIAGRKPIYKVDVGPVAEALALDVSGWRSDALFPLSGMERDVTKLEVALDDGAQWNVERVDQAWLFSREPRVEAVKTGVEALVKELVDLEVLSRLEGAVDEKAVGLDAPLLKVGMREGDLRREVHVGGAKDGQPGVHHVKRLGDGRVFLVRVGVLAARLRDAPLDLLGREIFDASPWEAKRVVIKDADGKVLLEAERKKKADTTGFEDWKVAGQPDAVHERVETYLQAFKAMQTERWEALDSPAARAQRGLDRPMKLSVTCESFVSGAAAPTDVTRTLLLGKRDGGRIAALAEGGRAIGRIDATFLDQLERGFAKGTRVLDGLTRWGVRRLLVKDGQTIALELKRPGENWLDGDGKLVDNDQVDKLFESFEGLDIRRAEPRSEARLAATGLAAPSRVIEVTMNTEVTGGAQVTKALRIGKREGARDVWACEETGEQLGLLFDEPLRKLDAFIEKRTLSFPPVTPPDAPPQTPSPPQAPAPPEQQAPPPGAPPAPPPQAPPAQQPPAPPQAPEQPPAPPPGEARVDPPLDTALDTGALLADGRGHVDAMLRAFEQGDDVALGEEHALVRRAVLRLRATNLEPALRGADALRLRAAGIASEAARRDAPQDATGEVPCGACEAHLPATTPFRWNDPRPPRASYYACSMGHLDVIRGLLAE